MDLFEATLRELYQSTVDAFPNTTKRQYATDTISISRLEITPFLGMKTLMIKGLAQNEGKEYNPFIVFKQVSYQPKRGRNIIEIADMKGEKHFLERLSTENNDVLVRCNCQDFYWRFTHTDHEERCLMGRDRKKYEAKYNPGSANPLNKEGMCKHLLKLMKILSESKIII